MYVGSSFEIRYKCRVLPPKEAPFNYNANTSFLATFHKEAFFMSLLAKVKLFDRQSEVLFANRM
jgi:hypothetical protein